MKPKPPKSWVLCIKASSGKIYAPCLSIGGERIQTVGDRPFKFFGMHIRVPPDSAAAKRLSDAISGRNVEAIDAVPVTRNQKLHLYKQGVCPRLTWPLLVNKFPVTLFKESYSPTDNSLPEEVVRANSLSQHLTPVPLSSEGWSWAATSDDHLQEAASLSPHTTSILKRPCSEEGGSAPPEGAERQRERGVQAR